MAMIAGQKIVRHLGHIGHGRHGPDVNWECGVMEDGRVIASHPDYCLTVTKCFDNVEEWK